MSIQDYHVRLRIQDSPDYYKVLIQTDVLDVNAVDPDNPTFPVLDFVILDDDEPTVITAVPTGLDIQTDVGSAVVGDITSIVADPDDTKFCLVSVVRDNASQLLEVQVQEKVLGNYADTPDDKTWECDVAEFSVVAAGTDLVEV
jgi:hypothetical protein